MTGEEMLAALAEQGETGSDYNEGLDGYFGWRVDTDGPIPVLVVTFEEADPASDCDVYEGRWALSEVPS